MDTTVKAVVYAPNKNYRGVSAGCTFIKGSTETDNKRVIQWFREHGYKVECEEQAVSIDNTEYQQLKKMAKTLGIKNYHKMKQEELVQALQQLETGNGTGDDKDNGTGDKVGDDGDTTGGTKV